MQCAPPILEPVFGLSFAERDSRRLVGDPIDIVGESSPTRKCREARWSKSVVPSVQNLRVKVFPSSVIAGYEQHRAAACDAAVSLGHAVLPAEALAASATSPQRACLAAVREADVVVLLMGERYGAVQPSGLSATHEEYREARDRKPVLVFVEECGTREPAQQAFLDEVQRWETGHLRASYSSPEILRSAVVRALHVHELAHASGPVDEKEMLDRAVALLPARGASGAVIALVVVGGPHQQVLRPAELGEPELGRELQREAMFGDDPVLRANEATTCSIRGDAIRLQQPTGGVVVDQAGSIMIVQPAVRENGSQLGMLRPIIEEDLVASIAQALRFAGRTLDRIDPLARVSDVVLVAGLLGGGYLPIRSRAEHAASPNSMPMASGGDSSVVNLTPARRHRHALVYDAERIAEDLAVLLARARQS